MLLWESMPYADGEPRLVFRGVVSMLGACFLVLGLLVIAFMMFFSRIAACSLWLLSGFLAGKLSSYLASTYLHRFVHAAISHKLYMQLDYFAVSVSIFATTIPTAARHSMLYYSVASSFVLTSGALVILEWETMRIVLTFVQFVFTIAFIGSATQFDEMWTAGTP